MNVNKHQWKSWKDYRCVYLLSRNRTARTALKYAAVRSILLTVMMWVFNWISRNEDRPVLWRIKTSRVRTDERAKHPIIRRSRLLAVRARCDVFVTSKSLTITFWVWLKSPPTQPTSPIIISSLYQLNKQVEQSGEFISIKWMSAHWPVRTTNCGRWCRWWLSQTVIFFRALELRRLYVYLTCASNPDDCLASIWWN